MQLPFESWIRLSLGLQAIWTGFGLPSAEGCSHAVACPVVITDGITNSKLLCTRNAIFLLEKNNISQSYCSFLKDLTEVILLDLSNTSIDAKAISWGIWFQDPFDPEPPRPFRELQSWKLTYKLFICSSSTQLHWHQSNWQIGHAFVCSVLTCGSLREIRWPCSAGSQKLLFCSAVLKVI